MISAGLAAMTSLLFSRSAGDRPRGARRAAWRGIRAARRRSARCGARPGSRGRRCTACRRAAARRACRRTRITLGSSRKLRAAGGEEALADEEIPVAVHDVDRDARVRQVAEALRDFGRERVAGRRPSVRRRRPSTRTGRRARRAPARARASSLEEAEELLVGVRALAARCRSEMKSARCVTPAHHFLSATSVADSMTTISRGTSVGKGPPGAGRRLGDLHHHVHARHDLAEHRVAPAVLGVGARSGSRCSCR